MRYIYFFYAVFFKLLPKFTDFINSDDCTGKIFSRFIRNNPYQISPPILVDMNKKVGNFFLYYINKPNYNID